MIENRRYRIERSEISGAAGLAQAVTRTVGKNALRWYIGQVTDDAIIVEATVSEDDLHQFPDGASKQLYPGKSVVLSIIPTGIGCNIGGYAGDAAPITNLLASTADYLITNPNAMNASNFIGFDDDRVLFTDGCCIDLFSRGAVDLRLPYSNRIGLVVEKTSERQLDVIFNVVNTVRAVHSIDIVDVIVTPEPIGGRCVENASGAIVGSVDNPQIVFDACERLLEKGATAVAVTSNIQDVHLDDYAKHFEGEYPNPVGGVEAVISYSITNRYQIPAAHAPLMNIKPAGLTHRVVDARGAGEMASESGLACILIGLRRAAQISDRASFRVKDVINVNNLLAVVAPASSLGGIPALYAERDNIPIIAVEENRTVLDVGRAKLGMRNVIEVRNYAEAAGIILALKKGINLQSIRRPLETLRHSSWNFDEGRLSLEETPDELQRAAL